MHLRRIIAFSLLLGSALSYAQAYKWVDEEGVVHYSDRPRDGAELVELPSSPSPRVSVPTRAANTPTSAAAGEAPAEEQGPGYQTLTVASPAPEVTLWNLGGTLDVSLNLQPRLQAGHRVRLYFDGAVQDVSGTSFQLREVYRGEHTIQAEVVDQAGELQIRSEGHRFYVQQTSVTNN